MGIFVFCDSRNNDITNSPVLGSANQNIVRNIFISLGEISGQWGYKSIPDCSIYFKPVKVANMAILVILFYSPSFG